MRRVFSFSMGFESNMCESTPQVATTGTVSTSIVYPCARGFRFYRLWAQCTLLRASDLLLSRTPTFILPNFLNSLSITNIFSFRFGHQFYSCSVDQHCHFGSSSSDNSTLNSAMFKIFRSSLHTSFNSFTFCSVQ